MNKTILFLEDDESLAFVTKRSLERRGFKVLHSLHLDGIRDLLKNESFDYALLDLKIGNQTSLELIQDIREAADVPIVILTGYGTIRTAVKAMKLGAVDFLSKPSSVEEIIAALEDKAIEDAALSEQDLAASPSLKSLEREAIQKALDENNGNVSAAARQLKMHRRTLQRKLAKRHTDV